MAKPQIVGTLLRQIDMNFCGQGVSGGWSNKDYRISVTIDASGSYHVYTEHGPAGRLQNGAERHLGNPSLVSAADSLANDLKRSKQAQRDAYKVVNEIDQRFAVAPIAAPTPLPTTPKPRRRHAAPPKSISSLPPAIRGQIHSFF